MTTFIKCNECECTLPYDQLGCSLMAEHLEREHNILQPLEEQRNLWTKIAKEFFHER